MERRKSEGKKPQIPFILNSLGIILESALIVIFCLVTETKGQTFCGIPGIYLTSGDMAEILSAHFCSMKCTREIQL